MSREIKFRAWDTHNERMFYEPYLFSPMTDYSRTEYGWIGDHIYYEEWTDVDDGVSRPCFLLEYSGINDKVDAEIWDGDIIKDALTGVVYKVINGFCKKLAFTGWYCESLNIEGRVCALNADEGGKINSQVEKLGDIYQNPELINQALPNEK